MHLRILGSPWPDAALVDLALQAVFLNSSLWLYWAYAGAPLAHAQDRLADTIISLFAHALDGGVAPTGPLARALPQLPIT